MAKLGITTAVLLALALPAGSNAAGSARWVAQPSCTATTTVLSCTGRAAGVHPQAIAGLGPVEAGIRGEVHYTCVDPMFQAIFYGYPVDAPSVGYFAETAFHNGNAFSIDFTPPEQPLDMSAQDQCLSGQWIRDPNYYNVSVAVGWGFGSYNPIEALSASTRTVLPGS
jgi:hypothetical protein